MRPLSPLTQFRIALGLFIAGLALSGVTAFPLLHELRLLASLPGVGAAPGPEGQQGLAHWIFTVLRGLEDTYARYPWLAYGTDWLAFGHIVIALFFVGPFLRPAESRMNLITGIVACVGVFPQALIAGPIRGIPFYWRLIDCSFGLFGMFPLIYCLRLLPGINAPSAIFRDVPPPPAGITGQG